ncbi:MBOAT family O-acyltransferase [Priestia abyssalis]|uniref:MBOAT family O-acyltransferase n=1 Tax=Priestia abyssalis TaxID=1221450 RepID=UPI000995D11E|nr:MBOAT family protein [Priestia abyssalis]
MLFNSFEFIFFFLPLVFILYFLLLKCGLNTIAKLFLITGSLFFYAWWNIRYLPLILVSVFVNYMAGQLLTKQKISRRFVLLTGIIFNVSLLFYFKYANFFIENVNTLFHTQYALWQLALPLGISFFTFQQIAYLVDTYRGETKETSFFDYILFVTFFPQLIAGPIVHHKSLIPQFSQRENQKIRYSNLAAGFFVFSVGLFKKVGIADHFSLLASQGFDQAASLTFIEAWAVSLSYTFQLYFDFSGYSDMAIGLALLFNIRLPKNFDSPYKALNIQDFWRRWHITLSEFLTKYIYIPLGGNRKGEIRTLIHIFLVFFISGFWHGAGWTFIVWGMMHGVASIVYRLWKKTGVTLNKCIAWLITFNFVNAAWVFFRAESIDDAVKVLKGMAGLNGISLSINLFPVSFSNVMERFNIPMVQQYGLMIDRTAVIGIVLGFIVVLFFKNSIQLKERINYDVRTALFAAFLFSYAIINLSRVSEFIYFNF